MTDHSLAHRWLGTALVCLACLPFFGCQQEASTPSEQAGIDRRLTGLWSSVKPEESGVGPGGRPAESPEWYLFDREGTYKHGVVVTGGKARGVMVIEGTYVVDDGYIHFSDCAADWYPIAGPVPPYESLPTREARRQYGFEKGPGDERLVMFDRQSNTRFQRENETYSWLLRRVLDE